MTKFRRYSALRCYPLFDIPHFLCIQKYFTISVQQTFKVPYPPFVRRGGGVPIMSKNTGTMCEIRLKLMTSSMTLYCCLHCKLWIDITHCSSVSITALSKQIPVGVTTNRKIRNPRKKKSDIKYHLPFR